MEFSGFGRRRRGRPLMLGVRLHAFREASPESEPSERVLYEFGLQAAGVRYRGAPLLAPRFGTVRVDSGLLHWAGMS